MTTSITTASTSSNEAAGLILPDKENNPLPTVDHGKLADPQDVVDRNFKLLSKAKLPTLAVRKHTSGPM